MKKEIDLVVAKYEKEKDRKDRELWEIRGELQRLVDRLEKIIFKD